MHCNVKHIISQYRVIVEIDSQVIKNSCKTLYRDVTFDTERILTINTSIE